MLRGDALKGRFEKRARSRPIAYAAEIGDDGLVLGAGTVLARMTRDSFGAPALDVEEDDYRLFALLAAALGRPMSPDLPRHLGEAFAHWRRGDKALANIRLAFAAIPRLDDRSDAYRLFLAEEMLDAGMSPAALMKGLGFDPPRRDLAKYDPNQPRVPAGSGRNSGRWGSGGGAAQGPAPTTSIPAPAVAVGASRAAGTLAEGLFASGANSAFLSGLETLASAVVGPAVMLGAIFIPTAAGVVSHGPIPGEPGLSYSFDQPEGVLRLYRQGEAGQQTVAEAWLRPDGIFAETETGLPIARTVKGSLVFDADSLPKAKAEARTRSERDEPKLCPDPGPDVPHGAPERAIVYQEQISRLNNPQRSLLAGMAVSLENPLTGKNVAFDDCRESDGTMIEAKGPGYAEMLKDPFFSKVILPKKWTDQAKRQIDAARPRDVEWYFAEPAAAERQERFSGTTKHFKKSQYLSCAPRSRDE
jgi:Restriction endonuclease fold toxin 5